MPEPRKKRKCWPLMKILNSRDRTVISIPGSLGHWIVPHHHWKLVRELPCQLLAGTRNIYRGLPQERQLIHSLTCSKCCPWLKSDLQSCLHGTHVTGLPMFTKRQYKNYYFINHCCVGIRHGLIHSTEEISQDKLQMLPSLFCPHGELSNPPLPIAEAPILCVSAH